MSIRLKIITLVFIIVLLTGGIATLVGRSVATNIVKDEIDDQLITTARSRVNHIETLIQSQRVDVEIMAGVASVYIEILENETFAGLTRAISGALTQNYLESMVTSNDRVREAIYIQADGIVQFSASGRYDGLDVSDTEAFIKGKEGTFVGDTSLSQSTDDLTVAAAAPVYIFDNQLDGVFVFIGGEEHLFGITTDINGLGETGETFIVNKDGYMITPSRFQDNSILQQEVGLPAAHTTIADYEIITRTNYMGSEVIGLYSNIPELGWTVAVEMGSDEVFAPVSRLTNIMLWCLLGVLLLGAVLAALVSGMISRPIARLKQGAEQIMTGNWDYRIATSAKDEVGELSRAFADMTGNLRQSQEELKEYSTSLEQKVDQRTGELSEANTELSRARQDLEIRVQERTQELESANELLQRQITEREVLLKEIHHRVKNNLQVISSLLSLQSKKMGDAEASNLLTESQDRIKSMSLIHERLYRSDDLAVIDFGKYVEDLSNYLLLTHGGKSGAVALRINVDDISLGIDRAIPCGLFISELVTNSLKHAFPNGSEGEIHVECHTDGNGNVILEIGDNGIGFPEGVDFRNTESLGLQLVNTLVSQIDGDIELHKNGGAEFSIRFNRV